MLRNKIRANWEILRSLLVNSFFSPFLHFPREAKIGQHVIGTGFVDITKVIKDHLRNRNVEKYVKTIECEIVEQSQEKSSQRSGEEDGERVVNKWANLVQSLSNRFNCLILSFRKFYSREEWTLILQSWALMQVANKEVIVNNNLHAKNGQSRPVKVKYLPRSCLNKSSPQRSTGCYSHISVTIINSFLSIPLNVDKSIAGFQEESWIDLADWNRKLTLHWKINQIDNVDRMKVISLNDSKLSILTKRYHICFVMRSYYSWIEHIQKCKVHTYRKNVQPWICVPD